VISREVHRSLEIISGNLILSKFKKQLIFLTEIFEKRLLNLTQARLYKRLRVVRRPESPENPGKGKPVREIRTNPPK